MSSWNSKHNALDLNSCAREPIRTPGAIQPYGLVLVLDPRTLTVKARALARADLMETLGDPLGQTIDTVLGGALASCRPALEALAPGSTQFLGAHPVGGHGGHHTLAHRLADDLIVELEEPVSGEPGSLEDLYPAIRAFMVEIERVPGTRELCELAALQIRALTGFDRTLVYQFDTDWNGAVVAENGNGVLPSYLDLRFPESEIPAQAR